ncbi:unnamed protein product, partial [Rotaria sp. Silwood1]
MKLPFEFTQSYGRNFSDEC